MIYEKFDKYEKCNQNHRKNVYNFKKIQENSSRFLKIVLKSRKTR